MYRRSSHDYCAGGIASLTVFGLAAFIDSTALAQTPVVPTDGMVITADTVFVPGTYTLPNGITIGAANITLDGDGAVLIGQDVGNGLMCASHPGVTVTSLTIRDYFHGMHFDDCDDLTVADCNVRDTPELPEGEIFLDIFDGPDGSYAHAMWFRYCDRASITGNDVSDQQNGISLFDCTQAHVAGNYASYNTGWGITLYDSDHCLIENNTADYCTRDYHGWSGADAASVLIVAGSDYNQVLGNSLVGGGDGVFLSGPWQPNNFNYFAFNDCSDSPNNGFEGTFSRGNVFENNISNGCNYGYWLGYSWENEVRNNQANNCREAGVAIEHGRSNVIEGNTLQGNYRGIWLWTDDDYWVGVYPDAADSYGYTIRDNLLVDNNFALYSLAEPSIFRPDLEAYDYLVVGNTFLENRWGIVFVRTHSSTLRRNAFHTSHGWCVRLAESPNNLIYDNHFACTYNAWDNLANTWNVEKMPGTNIVGGPFLGGNYWDDYAGADLDGDCLGDADVPHDSDGYIQIGGDLLPLMIVRGDLDHDGDADLDDVTVLLQDFGCAGENCDGDIDADGDTDLDDLTLLLDNFGVVCS